MDNFPLKILIVIFLSLFFVQKPSYCQSSILIESSPRPSDKSWNIPDSLPISLGISVPRDNSREMPASKTQQDRSTIIILEEIQFEGNTVFSNEKLNQIAEPYLHKPVDIDALEELRRLITHHYINQGYVTSGATFSDNPIKGKTLHIKIIEGRVGTVHVYGEERLRSTYIKNRLIRNLNTPLNMNELQDRFRLLLIDPLFDRLNGKILPGPDRGISILNLEVKRSRPYQFSAVTDNYRAPSVGAIALGAHAWISNLTKNGDLLDFTFLTSAPTGGDAFQYSGNWLMPLGDYGTKAYFSASNTTVSIVEEPLTNVNIKSNSFSVEGGFNQTLVDSLKRRLILGAGIGVKENETRLLGESFSFIPGLPSGKSHISVVRINQEYIERWERLVWAFRSTFSVGLDALGSTIQSNHLNPDSEYLAWLGQTRGLWNLPSIKSDFVLKGAVQVSNDPLLPLERIAVGGRNSVRGYRENQLVRDNGYSGSAELHIHLVGDNQDRNRFDLVPFFDFGAAWNHNDSTPARYSNPDLYSTQHIYSAGIGFQLRVSRIVSELFWAHRLKSTINQQHGDLQDHGIHFQARLGAF